MSVRSRSSVKSRSVDRKSNIRAWRPAKNTSGFCNSDRLGIDQKDFELSNRFMREMKQEDDLDNTRHPRFASTGKDLRDELNNLREKYPDMGINEWISLVRAKYTRHVNRLWLPKEKLNSAKRLASAQAYSNEKFLN